MADVLTAGKPCGLLQRRLDRSQHRTPQTKDMVASSEPSRARERIEPASLPLSCLVAHRPASKPTLTPRISCSSLLISDIAATPNPYVPAHNIANAAAVMFALPSWVASNTRARTLGYSLMVPEPCTSTEEKSVDPHQIFYDSTFFESLPKQPTSPHSLHKSMVHAPKTHIDNLMHAITPIQHTDHESYQSDLQSSNMSLPPTTIFQNARSKRRYQCPTTGCDKAFDRKTYLDIHSRTHTGLKPFICEEPGCGLRFSQPGNRNSHQRRHTGERPYHCDVCGKSFRQHGNVRAHMVVHTAAKPYTCKLDNCGKYFTQLGNLKSHQNKFHVNTLRLLKGRFDNISEGDVAGERDKAMWDYFTGLYKHCNKGIKGRGKDSVVIT